MNSKELEEFAEFLRMAEMSNNGNRTRKQSTSFWTSYEGKSALSIGGFIISIMAIRGFGHTLL